MPQKSINVYLCVHIELFCASSHENHVWSSAHCGCFYELPTSMLVLARALLLIVEGVHVAEQHNVHKKKNKDFKQSASSFTTNTHEVTQMAGVRNKKCDFICFILVLWAELSCDYHIFLSSLAISLKCLLNLKWCYCLLKYTISVLLMCICKLLKCTFRYTSHLHTHTTSRLTTRETLSTSI